MRRVLIAGGGAAAYAAAQVLVPALRGRSEATLSLIAPRPDYALRPLLGEVASGTLKPQLVTAALARLGDFGPIEILAETIQTIDLAANTVLTATAARPYDYLLLALEAEPAIPRDWRQPGWPLPLATETDATGLHDRLCALQARRGAPQSRVVIIGGGAQGVDLAARLAVDADDAGAAEDTRNACDVLLVEGQRRLLPSYPPEFGEYAASILAELGVEVRRGARATDLSEGRLTLSGGQVVPVDVAVWTAGERPVEALRQLEQTGVLRCNRFLRLADHPNVAMAGAVVTGASDPPRPDRLAYRIQTGRLAAANLLAAMAGRAGTPPVPYANLGRRAGRTRSSGGDGHGCGAQRPSGLVTLPFGAGSPSASNG